MCFSDIDDAMKGTTSWFPTFDFTFIPEAAELAAKFPEVTDKLHGDKTLSPFSRIINYYASEGGRPKRSLADMGDVRKAHWKMFASGMAAAQNPQIAKGLKIPEEYIIKVLE